MPLFSADHDRSPAIDHAIERPVQSTSPVSAATATRAARSSAGSGSRPKHAATSTPAAVRSAAPPTHGTLPSADAPPKNTAAPTVALPATTTAEAPERDTLDGRLRARSIRRHRSTVSGQAADRTERSPGRRTHKSFTLPEPPDHRQAGDFLRVVGRLCCTTVP